MERFNIGDLVYWRDGSRYAVITSFINEYKVTISIVANQDFDLEVDGNFELYITSLERVTKEFIHSQKEMFDIARKIVDLQYEEFAGKFALCS